MSVSLLLLKQEPRSGFFEPSVSPKEVIGTASGNAGQQKVWISRLIFKMNLFNRKEVFSVFLLLQKQEKTKPAWFEFQHLNRKGSPRLKLNFVPVSEDAGQIIVLQSR